MSAVTTWQAVRASAVSELEQNRGRREIAAAEVTDARGELFLLLTQANEYDVSVTDMATAAGISRETAHKFLRDAGVMTNAQQHRLAREAGIPPGPSRLEWFAAQGW